MSRYLIPAIHPEHRAVVGWDSPLASFFAQVIDQRIETAIEHGELSEDDADPMLLWIGTTLGELPTLEELQRARCLYVEDELIYSSRNQVNLGAAETLTVWCED